MTTPVNDVLADLAARGLLQDSTDRAVLAERLGQGPVSLYCGFDPTADSLHVGNLVGLLALRRFQEAGHRPLVVAGGATGMVGDPSGRSDERNLLDADTLAHNLAGIKAQIERFLDFTPGPQGARMLDNYRWTGPVTLLEFLRDVGKHATVNQMVAKESVRSRMDGDSGISFTEFSYMLLQANDFWWLNEHEDCELQVGGSDQWGNITAGIDLIRKRSGRVAHGLTWPLMTKADGAKFGKSQAGNVWLSAERTSPYQFFQFWMQTDDRDVERFLMQLTLLPVDEVRAVAAEHAADPGRRTGPRRLAQELTALVHGVGEAQAAEAASAILFGGDVSGADAAALAVVAAEVPSVPVSADAIAAGVDLAEILLEAGLATSKGEARRAIAQGGAYLNGARVGEGAQLGSADLLEGRYALLRKGKGSYAIVVVEA